MRGNRPTHRDGGVEQEVLRLARSAQAAGLGDSPEDAIRRHREALRLLGAGGNDERATPLCADVLRWEGTVYRDQGRTSDAEPLYHRSLRMASDIGYEAGVAQGLNCLASLAQRRGDVTTSANLLSDALAIAHRSRDTRLATMIQANLGIIADVRGNPSAAFGHYQAALRASESVRDEQQIAWVLVNLGQLLVKRRHFDEARRSLDRGVTLARAHGDLLSECLFEENLAELALLRGELDEAHGAIVRALEIAEQRHDGVRKAGALKLRAARDRLAGRYDQAIDALQHGLTLAAVGEDALLGAELLYQFGLALQADGDGRMAREVWKTALEAFERIGARGWVRRVRDRLRGVPSHGYV